MDLEICVDSAESAIAAERGGASRVELCCDLMEGGITPGAGLIVTVRRHIGIPVFLMIRPRGGDFCYTNLEFEVMRDEITHACQLGVNGFVLGILNLEGQVDIPRTRQLVEYAHPLPVTFHRALDMTPDPVRALEDVIATGASRVLTSGGAPNVTLGIVEIGRLIKAARGRIAIMPGGGITPENLPALAKFTGATQFHTSARTTFPSPVTFRKTLMALGDVAEREYQRFVVSEERVRALVRALPSSTSPSLETCKSTS